MPTFQYRAVDKAGYPAHGGMDAANEFDLEMRLKRMGLDLITCKAVSRGQGHIGGGRVTRQDLINFCFHLEQLLRAGVPLLDGLADLRDTADKPALKQVVTSLVEDMEGGKLLSQAMVAHPRVFDRVFVSLTRAGEQSGRLIEVFESLAGTLRWQDELVAQTRRLLLYPAMVFVVVSAVIVFLLLYLVPQLIGFLKQIGQQLPWQTKVLIFLSESFANYWLLILAFPVALAAAGTVAVQRSARARYVYDLMMLRLPVLGPIMQKIILARFANFFGLMYRSGITILDAIKTCEDIVANRVIADGLQRAGQQIISGDSLSESFQNLGAFPPLVIRMLRIGETTGALDVALQNITYFYNREVKESVERALKMLEPALTVVLGLILAFIMFAVLTPIYDTLGKLKF